MTQPLTTTDLEALLEAEVPCGDCGREAVLRSVGHGCPTMPGPFCKCLNCYVIWLTRVSGKVARRGYVRCRDCGYEAPSVPAFSDYRPF